MHSSQGAHVEGDVIFDGLLQVNPYGDVAVVALAAGRLKGNELVLTS